MVGAGARELSTVAAPGPVSGHPAFAQFSLDGQTAVVSGGASGIGRAVAEALAVAGAAVAILDVAEAGPDVAAELSRNGARAAAFNVDVTSTAALSEAAVEVEARLGQPRILVASAGISLERSAIDVSEEEWDRILDVNLKGAFFTCQAFAQPMLRGGGSMVLIASNFGQVAFADRAPYTASKSGLIGLARSLALEWAPAVRVNAVCPCLVRTPMVAERLKNTSYAEQMLARIPLQRIAEPSDIAAAALFLASDASAMVTGHALSVDGGWTIQ